MTQFVVVIAAGVLIYLSLNVERLLREVHAIRKTVDRLEDKDGR